MEAFCSAKDHLCKMEKEQEARRLFIVDFTSILSNFVLHVNRKSVLSDIRVILFECM